MTHHEAHLILDQRRAGHDIAPEVINTALELTGDLDHVALSFADALEAA